MSAFPSARQARMMTALASVHSPAMARELAALTGQSSDGAAYTLRSLVARQIARHAPSPDRDASCYELVPLAPSPDELDEMSPTYLWLRSHDGTRAALVYLCAGTQSTWRTRAERIPEPQGWIGGRVLWGYDRPSRPEALDLALRWTRHGALPGDTRA